MIDDLMGGLDLARKPPKWPPNSVGYYRDLKGVTLKELGRRVGLPHQTVQRLEQRIMELTPDYAEQLGNALGVPANYLGYPGYVWGVRLIPVVAGLGQGQQVGFYARPNGAIGSFGSVPVTTVAIEVLPGAVAALDGMYILFNPAVKEPMSRQILQRQDAGTRFVVQLANGSTWCLRRIGPGSRRGLYHLSFGAEYLPDVEIEWVSEIINIQPMKSLPPRARQDNGPPDNGGNSGPGMLPAS